MIAWVFSGGGNRGALQVGAARVLLAHGIQPDLLVGTSVGAINAAYLATGPYVATLDRLAEVWASVTKEDIYPGSRLSMLWRLITKQTSLFSNENLYRFLRQHLPAGIETFGDITAARLYIVATHLETGELRLFGEDPSERLLDAVMASTALPPLHPPWCLDDGCYVDGGAVADLPLRVAVDKGAREIYALHVPAPPGPLPLAHTLSSIANQVITALMQQQMTLDLERATRARGVILHHLELYPPGNLELPYWDFSHSAELIAAGQEQAEQYFQTTRRMRPVGWRGRMRRTLRQMGGRWQTVFENRRLDDVGPVVQDLLTPPMPHRELQ